MNEQEIFDALIKGAILHIDALTGDARIDPMDDVPPAEHMTGRISGNAPTAWKARRRTS